MSTFTTLVTDSKCSELHKVVKSGDDKYLCFTRLATDLVVCVSDGVSLWKLDMDEDEADALRDLSGINTLEAFLTKFRNGFQAGDLNVLAVGNKVTLTIGKGTTTLILDLYEAKAAAKKTEMQNVLFRLAESATTLSSDLDKAKQLVDTLKSQKGGGASSAFMDLGPKKGQNPAKAKPKKVGMSVLNPTSKKRKAAQGVVFD